ADDHDSSNAALRECADVVHGHALGVLQDESEPGLSLETPLCAERGTDGDGHSGRVLDQHRRLIGAVSPPAGGGRRRAVCDGLAGSGKTDSRSLKNNASLIILGSWPDRMSIFGKAVRSRLYSINHFSRAPRASISSHLTRVPTGRASQPPPHASAGCSGGRLAGLPLGAQRPTQPAQARSSEDWCTRLGAVAMGLACGDG